MKTHLLLTSIALSLFGATISAQTVDLSALDGTNGFTLTGIDFDDQAGQTIDSIGDFNGDSFADIIIGAPSGSPTDHGEAYVVFGNVSSTTTFDLASLDGNNGFLVPGIAEGDRLGISVSGLGDVNGDNISDLIIGASGANNSTGAAYILFGNTDGFSASFDLTSLDGSNGFRIEGLNTSDLLGEGVSAAGDVNNDGINDILIGAYGAKRDNEQSVGQAWVIFGSNAGFGESFDLNTLDGMNGFTLLGNNLSDNAGRTLSEVGDFNGDGIDDFIIGANGAEVGANAHAGKVYVVFGRDGWNTAEVILETLGTNGLRIQGIASNDRMGSAINAAGDINGDGLADILLGAEEADPNNNSRAGEVYVIFGQTKVSTVLNLGTLNGSNGFVIEGLAAEDRLGSAVSGVGDFNLDGVADFLIGAEEADLEMQTANNGAAYLIFGNADGFDFGPLLTLDELTVDNSITFQATTLRTLTGAAVATAGDVNGDGGQDILIGAPHETSRFQSGQVYLLFGTAPELPQLVLLDGDHEVFVNNRSPAIIFRLADDDGNALEGVDIDFSVTNPNGITDTTGLTPPTVTSDVNGEVITRLTSSIPGEHIVTATLANNPAASVPTTITFVDKVVQPTANFVTTSGGHTVEQGERSPAIVFRLTDDQNNPLAGVDIDFSVTNPGGVTDTSGLTPPAITSDLNGEVITRLTSDIPGEHIVTATVAQTPTVFTTTPINVVDVDAAGALSVANGGGVTVNVGETTSPIIFQLLSVAVDGTPVPGKNVLFTVTAPDGATNTNGLTVTTGTTDANGQVSVQLTPSVGGNHTVTAILEETQSISTNATVFVTPLLALEPAAGLDATGLPLTIATQFTGGISVAGAAFTNPSVFTTGSNVVIRGQMTIDPTHVGQVADVVLVLAFSPVAGGELSFFMINEAFLIQPWDVNPASLEGFIPALTLPATQVVDVFSGPLPLVGDLNIFFGYRLNNGALIFNGFPINAQITP